MDDFTNDGEKKTKIKTKKQLKRVFLVSIG